VKKLLILVAGMIMTVEASQAPDLDFLDSILDYAINYEWDFPFQAQFEKNDRIVITQKIESTPDKTHSTESPSFQNPTTKIFQISGKRINWNEQDNIDLLRKSVIEAYELGLIGIWERVSNRFNECGITASRPAVQVAFSKIFKKSVKKFVSELDKEIK